MADNQIENEAFFDGDIAPHVERVIREAREYVVLVSPYIEPWRHLKNEIERATNRNVPVTIFVRPEEFQKPVGAWLGATTAWAYRIEGLHAKIYLNESSLIVSSMNLYEHSTQNSYEFGLLIREPRLAEKIRKYVTETLVPLAGLDQLPTFPPTAEQMAGGSNQPSTSLSAGACIRCGRPLFFDPSKPLCDPCYDSWAQYENEDYEENFCLACGKEADTSYARPLCGSCYKRLHG